ncbi:MAG: rhodanese-like domain-containing protein [Gemmatimonadales bacterium]|nr:rhodanese-like domain-containing protein [Gemmatimonadales bacterium]
MEKRWIWLAMLLVALVAFAGCSDDEDDPIVVTEETAFDVMVAAGAAYINDSADCPGVMAASSVVGSEADYTIIDIRSETHYFEGHITGAYHSSLGTLVDDLLVFPNDKPYVVTCYSGQSAGHAKIAMELLGYEDVKSMKWGMCGWSTEIDSSWESNVDDLLVDRETTSNNGDLATHSHPVLTEDTGSVVVDRVEAMLQGGFKGISYINATDPASQLKGNEDDYFILNYWSEADYLGEAVEGVVRTAGHIPGAFQFTPYSTLGVDENLDNLPTDKPIVVYCWSGQHSSQIAAYLNMLGYEAYSLKFGANNLFHADLGYGKWTVDGAPDYTLVDAPPALPAFAALQTELNSYFNAGGDWYITATELAGDLALDDGAYTILDVRRDTDFDAGHIQYAINVSVADIPAQIDAGTIPTDLPFVVTCYTGQSAGYATAYLNLEGYNSRSLKFGMCSWNSTLSTKWNDATANVLTDPETENNNDSLHGNWYPVLADYTLDARLTAMMTEGLKTISYINATDPTAQLQNNEEDYFIVNYWGLNDYLGEPLEGTATARTPGHIPGAFQFTPGSSLKLDSMLTNLPSPVDGDPIVVYCWTGQTSAQITMYLRMLGYDAYSLSYGANSLFYDDLDNGTWSAPLVDQDLYIDDDGSPIK